MAFKSFRILVAVSSIIVGCLFIINIFTSPLSSLYMEIVKVLVSYMMMYFGISILLDSIIRKNKYIKYVFYKILSLPVTFLLGIRYLIAPILSFLMFLVLYITPSIIFLYFNAVNPIFDQYKFGVVYILSLFSIVLFAYQSTYVMRFVIDMHKTIFLRKQLFNLSNQSITRILAYLSMLIIYIFYNFLSFSNIELDYISFEMVSVVKEVFVTFIALDSIVQIITKENK